MNILLLMAGSSQAFKDAGYEYPKNLVEIDGAPLVQRVMEGLNTLRSPDTKFIYAIPRDENRRVHTGQVIELLDPKATIVEVSSQGGGAACTAMLAIEHINNDEPLIIINGDIIINYDLAAVIKDFQSRDLDGGVTVFRDVHPRWSFIKVDKDGLAIEVAEKRPISDLATTGFYYYKRGSDFIKAAATMLQKDASVDGKFYVCPAYNEMILKHQRIGTYSIPKSAYYSLKTPHDIKTLEEHLTSKHQTV